jgi:hypothetical protein
MHQLDGASTATSRAASTPQPTYFNTEKLKEATGRRKRGVRTVGEIVARARERLLAGGVPAGEAPGDAEVLARHALGWDLTRYAIERGSPRA